MMDVCANSRLPIPDCALKRLVFRNVGGGRMTSPKSSGIPKPLPRPRFANKFDRIAVVIVD
jgi:hypothetical protein